MSSSTARPSLTAYVTVQPSAPGSSSQTFSSQSLWIPCGARGVFGGQVIAQSLSAALQTITPPLGLHSQHCYFLLPAHATPPIQYTVEKLRDGKSYATRLVKAVQEGKTVFVLAASYTLPPMNLPPVAEGSTTPFSFTPNLDYGTAGAGWPLRSKPTRKARDGGEKSNKGQLSHSLRFAVEETSQRAVTTGTGLPDVPKKDTRRRPSSEHSAIPPFATRFQLPYPSDVLPFEMCEEEEIRWQRFLDSDEGKMNETRKASIQEYIQVGFVSDMANMQERIESPVSMSVARRRDGSGPLPANVRVVWFRARLSPGERPEEETIKVSTTAAGPDEKAMIAYMTDFQFIGTSARSVGLTWTSKPRLGMLATLDHTTHFYPFPQGLRADEPLLHVMESVVADVGAGRGLVRGAVFTGRGDLIASTLQEGVVRADLKGLEKGRGIVEGGGVGDLADSKESPRAKL